MRVLEVRNVHEALPAAIALMRKHGVRRDSRNGPVLITPWPVTTVYTHPSEKVCFWPERNANPFFHLYESLWMLAGRNDIAPLTRYVKRIVDYSDNGYTLNDAYGWRWRKAFDNDQLSIIANRLKQDPDDRRCVLQMWDTSYDLGSNSKAVPCNTMATFQRDLDGRLDLTVFCRSNDIIWGAYGANAVQFGTLLEYMAAWVGCPVGVYRQVSVNWHSYLSTFEPLQDLGTPKTIQEQILTRWGLENKYPDPYVKNDVSRIDISPIPNILSFDAEMTSVLQRADEGFNSEGASRQSPFLAMAEQVFYAHHLWKMKKDYRAAYVALSVPGSTVDWVVAAQQWLQRQQEKAS